MGSQRVGYDWATEQKQKGDTTGRQNNGNYPVRTVKSKFLKNENNLRDLWDTIRYANVHIIGVPEGEKGVKNVFDEIRLKTSLKKETYPGTGNTEGPQQGECKFIHTKT